MPAPSKLADRVLDDVIDDVGGRVIDAAGLADLRLFLHHGAVARRQADDLAEELLVDLAENLRRQHRKLVGAVGIVQALEDLLERLVVDVQAGRQLVGRLGAVLFLVKWKRPEL